MQTSDYCVFILTHGRPERVFTYNSIVNHGYTGAIFIVIDNEDNESEKYYQKFGDKVVMFDKKKIAKTFDEGDNFGDRRTIVYARNACYEIAKSKGFTYFIEFDDDYTSFAFKHPRSDIFTGKAIKNLDRLISAFFDFYEKIPASAIAMAQGGDFIGGANNRDWANGLKLHRKCMNTFFCSTNRPVVFVGRINEDVNTYVCKGSTGMLFLTVPLVGITQLQTQSNKGGMTEVYLDSGTYVKSFYTVMFSPSCATIGNMGVKERRLHHSIKWENAVPKIMNESHKKMGR